MSNIPAIPKTMVRAYIRIEPNGCSAYRSTVVDGFDPQVGIDAIKEVDRTSPPDIHNYVAYYVEQWHLGHKGIYAFWLDADGRPRQCPLELWDTLEQRYARRNYARRLDLEFLGEAAA